MRRSSDTCGEEVARANADLSLETRLAAEGYVLLMTLHSRCYEVRSLSAAFEAHSD